MERDIIIDSFTSNNREAGYPLAKNKAKTQRKKSLGKQELQFCLEIIFFI